MPKVSKYLSYTLLTLILAGVLAAGLVLVVYIAEKPAERVKTKTVNPETVVAPEVLEAGVNYTDKMNDDGTVTRTFAIGSSRYLSDKGTYEPVATKIVKIKAEYPYENTTNTLKTYFKDDGSASELVKFQIAGRQGAFGFQNANKTAAKVEGSTITYPDILPQTDAVYTVSNGKLFEELVVKEKTDTERYEQKLSLSGVYPKLEKNGSITFHDAKTKNLVFMIPQPVMYEKNDITKTNSGLHFEVTKSGEKFTISKVIDKAGKQWLATAAYPVVVDFVVQTFSNSESAMEFYISLNQGSYSRYLSSNDDTLQAGTQGCPLNIFRFQTYLSFNTSSLGLATVKEATLTMYMDQTGYPWPGGNPRYTQIYMGRDLWTSSTPDATVWTAQTLPEAYRGSDIYIVNLPIQYTNCGNNWSDCLQTVNVNVDKIAQNTYQRTQFVLPYTGFPTSCNPHYVEVWSSRTTHPPQLSVTYFLEKPILVIQPPSVSSQLTITLTDRSNEEDLWVVERSTTGLNGSWTTIICDTTPAGGMRTGVNPGTCVSGATYNCSTTSSSGTGGTCTLTDNTAGYNVYYYYRAYAYIVQDPYP